MSLNVIPGSRIGPLAPADRPAQIHCLSFKPVRSGSLRGFASVHVPKMRLRIHGIALHERDSRRWAQLPTQAMVRDGELLRDADGKPRYSEPVIGFDDAEIGAAFSSAVVQAVEVYAPEAFDGGR